ncbi:thioesterase II family protein [Paenibacillus macquariensis]|uniref:Surfactin synthase thioesterase subunit n=1 Tax=Paenibacillus macquariensis TaxID=948756 RepID=A0ABY1K2X0_9BACL|nr:thioesterase domain-containing protein [Paenibacillus macquariensis]MEC0090290.1 thioesterase domain-containing protein [Paenibacillus macquariensis]OAB39650.1 hypothetical protein PMSM_00540 [Paenibacillus macquariensis subsp. macquariensis]SIR18907.1 Surfactin synthase thioesterase subunit [Paenibacillus macquariensis]
MKLICLPYAGAHVNVFADLEKYLKQSPLDIKVVSLEYAGHGRRFSEKAYDSIHDNARNLYEYLVDSLDPSEELMLLGYSMGSIVAYEVAQLLLKQGFLVTKLMFMAATPPHKIQIEKEDYLNDDELLERCQIYGLIKENQFASQQMRKLFLPTLRSDIISVNKYNMINLYQCHSFDERIDIAIFQGKEDMSVSSVKHWSDITEREIRYYDYPAGHFFFYEYQEAVNQDIVSFISDVQDSLLA